jgi:hypothetical protein
LPGGKPIFAILKIRSDNLPADSGEIPAASAGVATGLVWLPALIIVTPRGIKASRNKARSRVLSTGSPGEK